MRINIRFDGYSIPPEKNGDYAWFLHVLKSLDTKGKAGIVMPHGVLFRGNAEETIRIEILKKRYIKGVVSLPLNLFYGTGIPACIIIIDKEDAETREGIFLIDASRGFKKDGSKNRLREQDIEKIVQTFINQDIIPGYSRFVKYSDVLDENGGNLNIPRYIPKIDDTLPQNIAAHLKGGIPGTDVDSLKKLWSIAPDLKQEIFTSIDEVHNIYTLALASAEIEGVISQDESILAEKKRETEDIFEQWKTGVKDILLGIDVDTNPKELIRTIATMLRVAYEQARLFDNYDVYDCLLNYWNAKLQDDVYAIKAGGYEVAREIDYEYAKKKQKDESGETVEVDDTTKVKSFEGALIPKEIMEAVFFAEELAELTALMEQSAALEAELDAKKTSVIMDAMVQLVALFDEGKTSEMEALIREVPELGEFDIRNKNGTFGKAKLKAALKIAAETAIVTEIYADEYAALTLYAQKYAEMDVVDKAYKAARKALDEKLVTKYAELTDEEIKHLLFDMKWMAKLSADVCDEIEQVLNTLSFKVLLIAKRYEHTLGEIEDRTAKSRAAVVSALERMGYKW